MPKAGLSDGVYGDLYLLTTAGVADLAIAQILTNTLFDLIPGSANKPLAIAQVLLALVQSPVNDVTHVEHQTWIVYTIQPILENYS